MSSANLVEISSLPSLSTSTQHRVIDTLFEPSTFLHDLTTTLFARQQQQQGNSYSSYQDLIDEVGSHLSRLAASTSPQDRTTLFGILGCHPRLGEKSPAKLSELSKAEQANLHTTSVQTQQDSDEQASTEAELRRLNAVYEETFPGLRYVVFVNGRGRDVILRDMRRRIERGDLEEEISEIIQAMCLIASDRARKLGYL